MSAKEQSKNKLLSLCLENRGKFKYDASVSSQDDVNKLYGRIQKLSEQAQLSVMRQEIKFKIVIFLELPKWIHFLEAIQHQCKPDISKSTCTAFSGCIPPGSHLSRGHLYNNWLHGFPVHEGRSLETKLIHWTNQAPCLICNGHHKKRILLSCSRKKHGAQDLCNYLILIVTSSLCNLWWPWKPQQKMTRERLGVSWWESCGSILKEEHPWHQAIRASCQKH